MKRRRIAWGITGAGHFLNACVALIGREPEVDVFLSKAAEEVLGSYRLLEELTASGQRIFRDTGASAFPVTKLYKGEYDAVVLAPVTSNSLAKMVIGISDTLVTNLFAHAGKCRVPILVLPCDGEEELTSVTPQGDAVPVFPRPIDGENRERLAAWPGVTVVRSPAEISARLELSAEKGQAAEEGYATENGRSNEE